MLETDPHKYINIWAYLRVATQMSVVRLDVGSVGFLASTVAMPLIMHCQKCGAYLPQWEWGIQLSFRRDGWQSISPFTCKDVEPTTKQQQHVRRLLRSCCTQQSMTPVLGLFINSSELLAQLVPYLCRGKREIACAFRVFFLMHPTLPRPMPTRVSDTILEFLLPL